MIFENLISRTMNFEYLGCIFSPKITNHKYNTTKIILTLPGRIQAMVFPNLKLQTMHNDFDQNTESYILRTHIIM